MEWSERLPLIEAILLKDLRAAKWWWVAAVVLALIGAIMMTPAALSMRYLNTLYPGTEFTWSQSSLSGIYGLVALLTSLALGLAFSSVYTGEVRRGTIRSIILYPVDANDLILAKLASAFAIAFLFSIVAFLGFILPYLLVGVFPAGDFFVIFLTTFLMGFVALSTGVFLTLIIAHYTRHMAVDPSTMGGLFLLGAVLLTETVVNTVGQYLLQLSKPAGQYPSPGDRAAIDAFAKAVSVLSPQHMGARILGDLFGVSNMWPDVHVVVPVFVIVVAAGYMFAKRMYMDQFVR